MGALAAQHDYRKADLPKLVTKSFIASRYSADDTSTKSPGALEYCVASRQARQGALDRIVQPVRVELLTIGDGCCRALAAGFVRAQARTSSAGCTAWRIVTVSALASYRVTPARRRFICDPVTISCWKP
jgi:hypothetical protein